MSGIVSQADAMLLDTCAVIWLANGESFAPAVAEAMVEAGLSGGLHVSPVSAWEVGLLAQAGKMDFAPDPNDWFAYLLARPGIRRADLTEDIAIESAFLPGSFHRDPADRLLVATARARDFAIVTRDCRILDYAHAGHVRAIAC